VIIAIHVTKQHRGDHDADVEMAYAIRPGETVEALAIRLKLHPSEEIKIKTVLDPQNEA
jgi:hypothetical protein